MTLFALAASALLAFTPTPRPIDIAAQFHGAWAFRVRPAPRCEVAKHTEPPPTFLPSNADRATLRASFRRLARNLHPDACSDVDEAVAVERFQALLKEYEERTLSVNLRDQSQADGVAFAMVAAAALALHASYVGGGDPLMLALCAGATLAVMTTDDVKELRLLREGTLGIEQERARRAFNTRMVELRAARTALNEAMQAQSRSSVRTALEAFERAITRAEKAQDEMRERAWVESMGR